MNIFKIIAAIGKFGSGAEKVSAEIAKLEGVDFSSMSKLQALEKLNPLLNEVLLLAEVITNDEGDKQIESVREILNAISKQD